MRKRFILGLLLTAVCVGLLAARETQATPTFSSSGSVIGSTFVYVTKVDDFFLSEFDDGELTVGSSDFANLTAGMTWEFTDAELDQVATSSTQNSADFAYGDADGSPPIVLFPDLVGLSGSNLRVIGRRNQSTGNIDNFDGSMTLQLAASPSPEAQAFWDELVALNPGDPGKFVFSGTVDGQIDLSGVGSFDPSEILISSVAVPVVTLEPVSGPGPVQATLLGGQGGPGGVDIAFGAASAGDLSASFEGLTPSEVDAFLAGTGTTASGLGVLFAGGEAQAWDIEFSGGLAGPVTLTLSYDDSLFGPDFDETVIGVAHKKDDGTIETFSPSDVMIDPVSNSVTLTVTTLSPFFLTSVPEPSSVVLLGSGLAGIAARRRLRSLRSRLPRAVRPRPTDLGRRR